MKRERHGWFNGGHTHYIDVREEGTAGLMGHYTKIGWKRERYSWLNGSHTHSMGGKEKGTAA